MERRTRRHARRLADALHTDRVQAALERANVGDQLRVPFVEARLRAAARNPQSRLLQRGEGAGVAAVFERVLSATAATYPKETATVRDQLRRELHPPDASPER